MERYELASVQSGLIATKSCITATPPPRRIISTNEYTITLLRKKSFLDHSNTSPRRDGDIQETSDSRSRFNEPRNKSLPNPQFLTTSVDWHIVVLGTFQNASLLSLHSLKKAKRRLIAEHCTNDVLIQAFRPRTTVALYHVYSNN